MAAKAIHIDSMANLQNIKNARRVKRDIHMDLSAAIRTCLNVRRSVKVFRGNVLQITLTACTVSDLILEPSRYIVLIPYKT